MSTIGLFIYAVLAYLTAGIVFALIFLLKGLQRTDPIATKSSIGFKALIMPGCTMLWPIMLLKWVRS